MKHVTSLFFTIILLTSATSTLFSFGQNQLHSYRDTHVLSMAAQLFSTGSGGQITLPLPVYQGGTGVTDLSPNKGVVVANGANPVTVTNAGTTGTVLIGNTSADPSFSEEPIVTKITIYDAPILGTDGVNKDYVDTFAQGFNIQPSCQYATDAILSNSPVYADGPDPLKPGIGATLTATVNGVLTMDGNTTWIVGERVLVKDQVSTFQNGIYTVVDAGSAGSTYELIRATDFDTPVEIEPGDLVPVVNGVVNKSTFWLQTETVTTVGVDPILFTKFLGQGIVTLDGDTGSATGLTVTIAGGTGITTSAAAATVTIDLDTPVAVANGGTGISSYTVGDLIYASGPTTLSKLADVATGNVLLSGGVGVAPAYGKVSSSGAITGTTDHAVQVGNASGSLTSLTVGTNGQVLLGATAADPAFRTPTAGTGLTITTNSTTLDYALTVPVAVANGGTGLSVYAVGDLIYASGTTTLARLADVATGNVLLSGGVGVAPSYGKVSASGAITGTTNHAVQVGNSTGGLTSLAVGTNGQVLLGATAADPSFVTPTAGTGLTLTSNSTTLSYALTTPVTVPNGGTGNTSLTQYAVLVGNGTSAIATVSPGASLFPLISTGASSNPSFASQLTVPGGGTGLTTLTTYALLAGGTTTTGNVQQVSNAGATAGQVLTYVSSSALPTWQNGTIQTATVTLSTANVTGLASTPIQVVAAPGAGKTIYVINAMLKLTHATTAFSSATGTIDLVYTGTGGTNIISGLGSNAFVTSGATNLMGGINGGQTVVTASTLDNAAVYVSNPGAAFTGGGTSTIQVAVNYVTLTFS